jgi:16S rRNA (cytosine967-C5)-methyltransferase
VELARNYGHRGTAGLCNAVLRRVVEKGAARWASAGSGAGDSVGSGVGASAGFGVGASAVLRPATGPKNVTRTLAERWALAHSHPVWLVERWLGRWGPERVEQILAWNQSAPDYWIRLAPAGSSERPGLPSGATEGWIPGAARLRAGSRPQEETAFAEGGFTVQDGSGIVVGNLAPEVRGRVLDLCAAPGTKTGHLLERGGDAVEIVAADRSPGRLRRMRRGLSRLGREAQVSLVAADGRHRAWACAFDGVLVDAPCTNLGVIRRRVDVRWRVEPEEIERLGRVQAGLLDAAAAGVAPGGWLVYSVCTIEPEETRAQRQAFLERHAGWTSLPLPVWVPGGARGDEGELLLLPGEFETDGGYAFVLRKEAR